MGEHELVNSIMYLIGTIGAKAIAELVASWRIAKRLKTMEDTLTAFTAGAEATRQEVAAHHERLTALEDLGPVLR